MEIARCAKFIARKGWLIVGTDDNMLRVFNYKTGEKVASIDGHSDYIRSIAVHPTKPFILSCSDDMTIKMWDWEKSWKNICVSYYVPFMALRIIHINM